MSRPESRLGAHLPVSPPTLADVAERAGVSRQTVSNAVNNPDLLRPGTLERVRGAMRAPKGKRSIERRTDDLPVLGAACIRLVVVQAIVIHDGMNEAADFGARDGLGIGAPFGLHANEGFYLIGQERCVRSCHEVRP